MKAVKEYDNIIIGGGIVGLAVALACAEKGETVAVFERHPKAIGASVRNFGMVWPIGQPAGDMYDRAMRSREVWLDISRQTGMWARETGSLHLAYHEDEMAVLEEFVSTTKKADYKCQLVTPKEVKSLSSIAKTEGLLGALWSETEVNIHSRIAIQMVADYLQKKYGVDFYFNCAITGVDFPHAFSFEESYRAHQHIYICSGADFETLYPSVFRQSGITKCKLQMFSTVSQGEHFNMGAMLCGGLTLRHYSSFQHCASLQALNERFDTDEPRFKAYGIHVLVSQNSWGQLIIGDSHEYGLTVDPFDKEEINDLIVQYLKSFANISDVSIADRWHGIYPKLFGMTEFVYQVADGVTIVNALSGAGMTLSFGLAQEIVQEQYVAID
jgi:D-hydroxyproline dehydrogenase subunit beta